MKIANDHEAKAQPVARLVPITERKRRRLEIGDGFGGGALWRIAS
jgi:hypothetical protein